MNLIREAIHNMERDDRLPNQGGSHYRPGFGDFLRKHPVVIGVGLATVALFGEPAAKSYFETAPWLNAQATVSSSDQLSPIASTAQFPDALHRGKTVSAAANYVITNTRFDKADPNIGIGVELRFDPAKFTEVVGVNSAGKPNQDSHNIHALDYITTLTKLGMHATCEADLSKVISYAQDHAKLLLPQAQQQSALQNAENTHGSGASVDHAKVPNVYVYDPTSSKILACNTAPPPKSK